MPKTKLFIDGDALRTKRLGGPVPLSRDQLAQASGLSAQRIADFENGGRVGITPKTLQKLLIALRCQASDISYVESAEQSA